MSNANQHKVSTTRRRADATPGRTHLRYVSPETIDETTSDSQSVPEKQVAATQAPIDRLVLREQSDDRSQVATGESIGTRDLFKSYRKGKHKIDVLRGVNMKAPEGKFSVILGQSGSGKSTLLHLLGTLDAPDSGEVHFAGKRIDNLSSAKKERLRNHDFGMIFQFYHLLPELTMLENVLVPKMISDGVLGYMFQRRKHVERAKYLLALVGLSHRLRHKPSQLSGGEMQRTAIARALLSNPKVLLADEPTGNLDSRTGEEILKLFESLHRERGTTLIVITHSDEVASRAGRLIEVRDGRIRVPSSSVAG